MNKSKKIKIISSVISCMGLATGLVNTSYTFVNENGVKVFNENTNDIVDFDNLDNLFNNNAITDTFNVTPEDGIEIKCTVLTEPTADKNGTVSVQGIDDISGHLVIPELVTYEGNDYDVTTIPDYGFSKTSTEYTGDLIVPQSITSIGKYAFSCTSGKSYFNNSKVTFLAQTPTIPTCCFESCSFTEIEILSETITEISFWAFRWNVFSKIDIPSNVTTIDSEVFSSSKLAEITFLSKSVIPYNNMFYYASDLNKINVSSNLIDEYKTSSDWSEHKSKFIGITVDSVILDQTNINALINDEPIKLNATVAGKYQDVIWLSSDESIVSVDKNGQLSYNGIGKATIKVESSFDLAKFATCKIEITEPEPQPEPEKPSNNLALILGLSLGLGIPVVAGLGFGTYYFINKNKK